MTTNITPKQALEFIQKELKNKTMTFENQCVLLDIIEQALAPQECDDSLFKDKIIELMLNDIEQEQSAYDDLTRDELLLHYKLSAKDELETNSPLKQLHSQQKTFTVEEIKSIIHKITDDNQAQTISPNILCKIQNDLLTEFEKAVG